MRSTVTLCRLKASSSLQAATLLAVLMTHLVLMASPLHTRMMAEASHGIDMTVMTDGEGSSAAEQWRLPNGHNGHCIIEWLKLDQRAPLALLFASGLAPAPHVLDLLVPGLRPIARALGPPSAVDPQALLQVFRE